MSEKKSIKISRILHAGYVFETNYASIVFDPIFENPFSRNCYAFPMVAFDSEKIEKLNFSAIFISHFHDDHCSLTSLSRLDRKIPIYIYCLHNEIFSLIKQLGFREVIPLNIDVAVRIKDFEIIPRRALDEEVDCLFQVSANGINILNVVDALIDPEALHDLSQGAPWDLVMWPFQTLREIDVLSPSRSLLPDSNQVEELQLQIQKLRPHFIIPSSCQFIHENWSWYNHALFPITYEQFSREIAQFNPNTQVIRLNPSCSIILSLDDSNQPCKLQIGTSLDWVKPIGPQEVDYFFDSQLVVPHTSEIATMFAGLSSEETEIVFNYCRKGLIEKFEMIGGSSDIYFNKKRLWQLSVFDHHGHADHFFYMIDLDSLTLLSEGSTDLTMQSNSRHVSWCTELPIQRFYGALILGEALPSMYFRINDHALHPEVERDLLYMDPLQDPLIRCLFNGAVASYQKAQLHAIQNEAQKMEMI